MKERNNNLPWFRNEKTGKIQYVSRLAYAVNIGIQEMVKNHKWATASAEQLELLENTNA